MPATAAFIDELRRVFGADAINVSIKRGMRGEAGFFYAEEGGHTLGTKKAAERSKCLYVGREGNLISYEHWVAENERGNLPPGDRTCK